MNLTFLNPFLLFGLAGVILPILIHRITQKKVVLRKFSAVRLLLQSQQVTARPQRLKHLLLLALRILAVATIVFMMARPVLVRPGFAALLRGGAKVLLLDNSLSMGYREDRGVRYDTAKKAAREALDGFGGQVALISTVTPPGQGVQGIRWMKPEEVPGELEAIPLSFGRGNTTSAVTSAYQALKGLKIPKQILILSDMARSDWESLDLTRPGVISDAEVTFFRIGGPGRDPNFRIKNVSLADGDMVTGVPNRLEVTLSNLSDNAGTTLVQVNLSGRKVDQKSVEMKAGQDEEVFFDLVVENPGWVDGEVTLSSDRLPADDVYYFPLKVREKIKVLVVDGDPKRSLRAGESYFLASALEPGGSEGSPFLTRVIPESEMARMDLRSYDSLFLLNVSRPDLSRVASFLEMGRPLFIFLGDRIDPEFYNTFSLAPWQIQELIDLRENPGGMTRIDTTRGTPKFLAPLEESLKTASFRTYYKVEGAGKNLLTLGNQDPLLVETEAGKSRLFLFTSSADLLWNDLALNAAYLPLVQGLVKEAVGLTEPSLPAGLEVGDPGSVEGRPLQVTGPRGGPGILQFRRPSGEMRRGVNTPPEESDLTKVTEEALKKKFGEIDVKVLEYKENGLEKLQGGRKDLWPPLFVFLLAVLALEMLLANGGISRIFNKQTVRGSR